MTVHVLSRVIIETIGLTKHEDFGGRVLRRRRCTKLGSGFSMLLRNTPPRASMPWSREAIGWLVNVLTIVSRRRLASAGVESDFAVNAPLCSLLSRRRKDGLPRGRAQREARARTAGGRPPRGPARGEWGQPCDLSLGFLPRSEGRKGFLGEDRGLGATRGPQSLFRPSCAIKSAN